MTVKSCKILEILVACLALVQFAALEYAREWEASGNLFTDDAAWQCKSEPKKLFPEPNEDGSIPIDQQFLDRSTQF